MKIDVGIRKGEGRRDDPRLWTLTYEPKNTDRVYERGGFTMFYSKGNDDCWSHEVTVVDGNLVIGSLSFGPHMLCGGALEGSVTVHPNYRRRGMATAMYDLAEELTCLKFEPAVSQSLRGEAFWKARLRSIMKA
jgi:ribosomal protein S18 acetylase RimI-like enzyme